MKNLQLEQLLTEIISIKADRLVVEFKMCLNGQPMCSICPEGTEYPESTEVAETLQQALQKTWDKIAWQYACDRCKGEEQISVPSSPGSGTSARRACPRCHGKHIDPEA